MANRAFQLVLVIVCAVALRGLFPAADPPPSESIGTVWFTEALWAHNARNRVLFGQWQLDPWNPMILSPTSTALTYLSFSLFGVGIVQARLVSIMLGALSLLFFYVALRRGFGAKAGLLALILAGGNYFLVMYSKVVMLETIALFFMLGALYCFQRAEENSTYQLGAGVASALALITKGTAWVFPLVGIVSLIWLTRQDSSARRRRLVELLWFSCGLIITTGAWVLFWMLPNADLLYLPQLFARERLEHLTWTLASFQALGGRFLRFPIYHSFFSRVPLLTLLMATGVATVLLRLLSGSRSLHRLEIFFVVWLFGSTAEIILFEHWFQRRYFFMIPPIIGVSVVALINMSELQLLERFRALNFRYRVFWTSFLTYLLYVLFGSLVRLMGFDTRGSAGVALELAVLLSVAFVIRPEPFLRGVARVGPFKGLTTVVIAVSLLIDLAQFVSWSARRSYTVREVTRQIGTIVPDGALVEGIVAPAFALGNRIRPIYPLEGIPTLKGVPTQPAPRYLLIHRFSSFDQDETVSEGKKLAEFPLNGFALEFIEGFAPLRSVELYLRHG